MRPSAPSGPRPHGNGRGQGRTPSQLSAWQAGSRNSSVIMSVSKSNPDCADAWTDTSSTCWPLDKHHFTEVFAVCSSIQTDDPPLQSGHPTPTARGAALRENRGHCLKFHEDSHSLRQCWHPFINASGCLNPDLGQLGDDGEAYRRWQTRMNRYRREDKSSCSNKKSHKQNHHRRGN